MAPSEEPTSKWDRQTGKPETAVRHTDKCPAQDAPAAAQVQRKTQQAGAAVGLGGSKNTSTTVNT